MPRFALLSRLNPIAQAAGLCLGATLALSPLAALAQSNTTGTIVGRVEATAGTETQLLIENLATGAKRRVSAGADGRFQVSSLAPGRYRVSLVDGERTLRSQEVEVLIGVSAQANFVEAMERVTVIGGRRVIDVGATENGATFTAKQLAALPVTRNMDGIVQLAPQTAPADPRYRGASFGGGAATENAYYINGFPVTSAWAQFGSSELPFGAIAQAQVLTGGFGVEFGRSLGGVVNIITKSGGNEWEGGGRLSWAPNSLRAKRRDVFYPMTGKPEGATTDGTLRQRFSDSEQDVNSASVFLGGPLIENRLFGFLALEQQRTDSGQTRLSTAGTASDRWGWRDSVETTSRYVGRLDWNLHDDHRLELTLVGDNSTRKDDIRGYNYATGARGDTVNARLRYKNYDTVTPVGADLAVLKYNGQLSDDLSLSLTHGKSVSKHSLSSPDRDVYDSFSGLAPISAPPQNVPAGLVARNNSPFLTNSTIIPKGAKDEVVASRIDLDYRLGEHSLRAGWDRNEITAINNGRQRPGANVWAYLKSSQDPNTPITMSVGPRVAPASGGGFGTQGYYVLKSVFETTTDAGSKQSALFLEDKWQAGKDLQLTGGLRHETFSHTNGEGQEFLRIDHQWQPRFAAAWDVMGDASLKLYGSAGRYAVQTPNQVSERHASRSWNTRQYFTYTGIDAATGAPTGLTALTQPRSPNNELGQVKDPRTLVATNLRPSYQDELSLGFEKAVAKDYNLGAKITYRKLRTAIDDMCDTRPFTQWAARNSVTVSSHWTSTFSCMIFNPGLSNTFLMDLEGPGQYREVKLNPADFSGEDTGVAFPKAKRSYLALDLTAEHPLRNGWYGKVGYTYSRNRGNTEGQTNSDVGQTDVSKTQTWDFPEQMLGAYGPLPNQRTHQLKAFGYAEINAEWSVGANLLIASGRPKNCTGDANPASFDPYAYGGLFYCDGHLSPRGSRGKLPGERRLDLNLAYKPEFIKGLTARVDVYNVTNRQSVQAIDELYEDGSGGYSNTYGMPVGFTGPRTVTFSVSYERKF
ncbi:hypothetical protein HNQ51_000497 [Inhella inkyongensis]|uniref:TonB-dependent receptor-like beta-barrel domain-containing protein n=1 Tax=Inhella inkyongensis TaxID=392593 RepID=A0A840S2Y7_9BURK|nr:TonB-dependent receptor [Inhella inkyongensis]MBB5203204.1 hypothetical protein [Inhella inkyongensis]